MKSFDRIFAVIIVIIVLIFAVSNIVLLNENSNDGNRLYRVEINRLSDEIVAGGNHNIDLTEYEFITAIEKYSKENAEFFNSGSDYEIREINGILYRFDYTEKHNKRTYVIVINIAAGIMTAIVIAVMIFIRTQLIMPFEQLKNVPHELAKGNLTVPVKENKSRFFGKFVWGINLLRENMEQQKKRELELLKEKKTLVLSLSHDIKTPLSAIKLYSKALSKGIYTDKEKQIQVAESIDHKADEIESYVSEIIRTSNEDFLTLEVNNSEFYLEKLMGNIKNYYKEKLSLCHIDFIVAEYSNCILKGDIDRSIEVIQNIMENAIKYGDGNHIEISFSEEENCQLITVRNSGCTLSETELPHVFDSFWRGSNVTDKSGSGLGLYICRQLMHKMNGDIFAAIKDNSISVTTVFNKA